MERRKQLRCDGRRDGARRELGASPEGWAGRERREEPVERREKAGSTRPGSNLGRALPARLGAGLSAALLLCAACSGSSDWEVEHRVEIAASPGTVWKLLTDLERYSEWNEYSPRVDGVLEVGRVVTVEAHLGDEVRLVDNLVTVVDAPRTLCWQSQNWYAWLARGTRCRHLEPLPNGKLRLRHHELMAGPLAGLVERLYRPRIEAGLKRADQALAAAAERLSGSGTDERVAPGDG